MTPSIAHLHESPTGPAEAETRNALPTAGVVPAAEVMPSDESSERGLYRRSVAYFLFGFGSNRDNIITDEP